MKRAVVAVVVLVVAGACASAAAAVPLPSQDPFYDVPPNISGLSNGTVLASRPVQVNAYSIPMPVHAWQVKYKTTDAGSVASADVATIMVPDIRWTGKGPRPLVSYQTAEDGISTECSPSYGLRAGVTDDENNSGTETGLMEYALLRGWAVVAPDYEGPSSLFLDPAVEAHGVLDGIRAVLRFRPDGLGRKTPLGIWGYSGGSIATDEAAQAQPTYAPRLRLKGIALGGLVANVMATLNDFSGGPGGGAIVMSFAGVNRDYPGADILRYFNAAGRTAIAEAQNDCLVQAAMQFPFASVSEYEAYPNVESTPAVIDLVDSISPLYLPGVPTAPIYDYHSSYDEFAPLGPDRSQMQRFCADGVKVDHVETPLGEHIGTAVTDAPGAVAYLAGRFAGEPAPDNCSSIPAP
jgi:Secretory lipase